MDEARLEYEQRPTAGVQPLRPCGRPPRPPGARKPQLRALLSRRKEQPTAGEGAGRILFGALSAEFLDLFFLKVSEIPLYRLFGKTVLATEHRA